MDNPRFALRTCNLAMPAWLSVQMAAACFWIVRRRCVYISFETWVDRRKWENHHAVWPSNTGTRLQAADIFRFDWFSKAVASVFTVPSIFCASVSSLSSSPDMKGTTLSIISILLTPGYPAPEIACIVTTETWSTGPNCAWMAANGMTMPMTAQLELQTRKPFSCPLIFCWCGIRSRCWRLTVGTTSGTSGSLRWFFALENTAKPACVNSSSRTLLSVYPLEEWVKACLADVPSYAAIKAWEDNIAAFKSGRLAFTNRQIS